LDEFCFFKVNEKKKKMWGGGLNKFIRFKIKK
jgi:hypothetical protein